MVGWERVGEGLGFTSELFRLKLQDKRADAMLPRSLIVKLSPMGLNNAGSRLMDGLFAIFSNEVSFYRSELAAQAGIRVPQCIFAHHDHVRAAFVVVQEDLAERKDGLFGSSIGNGASVEQARAALAELAKLHAFGWDCARARVSSEAAAGPAAESATEDAADAAAHCWLRLPQACFWLACSPF